MATISPTLKKLLFLEITNKQFSRLPDADYFKTWKELSEAERARFAELSSEAHDIWNYINSTPVLNMIEEGIDTFEAYCEHFEVSEEIKELAADFDLTLRTE